MTNHGKDAPEPGRSTESNGCAPETAGRLDALLRRLAARRHVRHAIVAVERGDGSARWIGATGEARPGGPPMDVHTPFFLASIDKLFTATVVMRLVEQERVRLAEPITTYLPPSITRGLHRLGGADLTGRITVRHLLAHTSGLPDYLEERPRDGRSLVDLLVHDGDRSWTLQEMAALVRDRLRPHFAPQPVDGRRARVRYSDTNYQLLIAIIEAVTPHGRDDVFRTMLFEPLGMRQTWLAGGPGPLDAAPDPAALWFADRLLHIPRAMASFTSVFSTVHDTLRFLRALVRGVVFEAPATAGEMQRRWHRFGLPLDRAALRAPGWPIQYGLGIMRFELPGWLPPFRRIPPVIGHTGSTGSWLFYCPRLDVLLSGTVDQATAGAVPFRFVPQLLRALQEDHAFQPG